LSQQLATLIPADGRWLALVGVLAVLLVVDLALVRGRGGAMSLRSAGVASACWVAIALAFFAVLLVAGDRADANAFLAGYLVEKSLSLDNVFVFLLVFTAFALPETERHRLLTYGIVIALVLRTVFIVVGAAALSAVSWLSFVFAAFLIWTGWRMFCHRHGHEDEQALVARLQRLLPLAEGPSGRRFLRREDGRLLLTVGGASLAGIALVDVVFAIDSVPAILAITDDTFIVFAANAFALLGLRPLFFLVADLVERLYYLKTALAALLVFIGGKMAAAEVVGKIGPAISLPVIGAILAAGVIASLVRDRRLRAAAEATATATADARVPQLAPPFPTPRPEV
jgi:tellurite resistance protein TerC